VLLFTVADQDADSECYCKTQDGCQSARTVRLL